MDPFYLEIRTVHIAAVVASGLLFLLRGLSHNLFGASWPMTAPVRYLAYAVDTVLLTAALMLMTIVQQYPVADLWLTIKVLLILFYIVLGYSAFRGKTRAVRMGCLAGALVVYGYIITVARAHDPLGLFA